MKKKPDICQICLRLDRELKVVDQRLSDFHDELCNFVLDTFHPKYCWECAHLLRKMYNFRVKCNNAIFVFNKWKKTKADEKKPPKLLYTLLPPTPLGPWTPDNSTVFTYAQEEASPMLCIDMSRGGPGCSISFAFKENTLLNKEIKLEKDCLASEQDNSMNSEDSTFREIPIEYNEELCDINMLINNDEIKTEDNLKDSATSDDDDDDENINSNSEEKHSDSVPIDGNQTKHVKQTKTLTNKSIIKLDIVSLSDDEFVSCDSDETKCDGKESVRKNDRSEKKNKTFKKVFKKESNKTVAKDKGITKVLISKEVANVELTDISLNDIKRVKKVVFSKDRLIAALRNKFESWGEIKTRDGTTIDKDIIIECLDQRVKEGTMRFLWKAVRRRQNVTPRALKIFKDLQKNYTNDLQYKSVFDIEYLTTEQELADEFQKRKTYECYINAEFKCEICYQWFKHEKKLEYHMRCHDESAGDVVCSVCSKRHKSELSLKKHMFSCHEAVYKCKLCPLITNYRNSMVNHYEQHRGKEYKCEHCGFTYKSRSTYLSHRGSFHSTEHICTTCGRGFYTAVALTQHQRTIHKDDTPTACDVKCSKCDLAFPSQKVYLTHLKKSHRDFKSEKSAVKASLKGPLRKTPKKCVMTCRVCNAVGNSYGWLLLHFRMKHPTVDRSILYIDKQKYLCHICGKGFSVSRMLQDHINRHTGSLPYTCAVCPKRFHSYVALNNHKQMHLPPSKTCKDCGKTFRTHSNLYNHQRIHMRDRRYKCNICGKGFLHGSSLNEHVRGVHNHVRRVKKKGVIESRAMKKARSKDESDLVTRSDESVT